MGKLEEALAAELRIRLKDRLTDVNDIDDVLRLATGVRVLDEYGTDQTPKSRVIKNLVDGMGDEGTLILFLRKVYAASPLRPDLQAWLRENFPGVEAPIEDAGAFDFQTKGQPAARVPDGVIGGLQRYVRPKLGDVDMLVWFADGLDVARCVCRIENNGAALGTGFLVGPDLVLTNWHVVQKLVPANATDNLACRFDFAATPGGGIGNGAEVDVESQGILAWSPAAKTEMPEKIGLPPLGPDTLDYALLKLVDAVGRERNWLDLSADAPAPEKRDPLIVVQHPAGGTLKMALDTEACLGAPGGGLRLRYTTNTQHGSSGAPVLTLDWRLVALHHLGDPQYGTPQFNQGIPIGLVRDNLKAQGLSTLIVSPK